MVEATGTEWRFTERIRCSCLKRRQMTPPAGEHCGGATDADQLFGAAGNWVTDAGDREQGLVRKRKRRAVDVPPEEAAELRRRHDAGESLRQLMVGFDGSYRTLRQVLE